MRIVCPDDLSSAELPLRHWVCEVLSANPMAQGKFAAGGQDSCGQHLPLDEWLLSPPPAPPGPAGFSLSCTGGAPLLLQLLEKLRCRRKGVSCSEAAQGAGVDQQGELDRVGRLVALLTRILGGQEWFVADFIGPSSGSSAAARKSEPPLGGTNWTGRCVERRRKVSPQPSPSGGKNAVWRRETNSSDGGVEHIPPAEVERESRARQTEVPVVVDVLGGAPRELFRSGGRGEQIPSEEDAASDDDSPRRGGNNAEKQILVEEVPACTDVLPSTSVSRKIFSTSGPPASLLPPGLACRLHGTDGERVRANLREVLARLHELCRRDFFYQGPTLPDHLVPHGDDGVLDPDLFTEKIHRNNFAVPPKTPSKVISRPQVPSDSCVIVSDVAAGPRGGCTNKPDQGGARAGRTTLFRFGRPSVVSFGSPSGAGTRETTSAARFSLPRVSQPRMTMISRGSPSTVSTASTLSLPSSPRPSDALTDAFGVVGAASYSSEDLTRRARPVFAWIRECLGRTENIVGVDEFGKAVRGRVDGGGDRGDHGASWGSVDFSTSWKVGGDEGGGPSPWDELTRNKNSRIREVVSWRETQEDRGVLGLIEEEDSSLPDFIEGESSILSEVSEYSSGESSDLSEMTATIAGAKKRPREDLRKKFRQHFAGYNQYWPGPTTFSDLQNGEILCDLILKLLFFLCCNKVKVC